jgi:hypothetical protein
MSAQGGTLQRRGTIELPIWPVAVLVVAAVAAAVGMTLLRDAGQTRFVTSVTDSERLSNSTAAVREQGAVAPAIPSIRPIDLAVMESSAAPVREQGPFGIENAAVWGTSHVAPSAPAFAGLENPAAYGAPATAFEKPGAYASAGAVTPPIERYGPIEFNGQACPQCR